MTFTIDRECATVACDERLTVTEAGPTLAIMEAERQGWWVEDPVTHWTSRAGCPEHGADCLREWDPERRWRVECEECGEVEWYADEDDAKDARSWHRDECAVPPDVSVKDTWGTDGDRGGNGEQKE